MVVPSTLPADSRDSVRRLSWLLFLALLVCYGYFVHNRTGWNVATRIALVRSIVEDGTLRIDRFTERNGDKVFFGGHYYSDKPPGSSLLAVPVHAVLFGIFGYYDEPATRYAITLLCLSLPSAVAGVIMFRLLLLLRKGSTLSSNLFLALAWSLGTLAFPYSTIYFAHQLTASVLLAPFYLLVVVREGEGGRWHLGLAGLLTGFAFLTEYVAALCLPLLAAYALWSVRRKTDALWFVLGAVPPLAANTVYNLLVFGSPLEFSYRYHATFGWVYHDGTLGLTGFRWAALYGITISPFRGLFYLAPFLLFAFPGFHRMWKANRRPEAIVCTVGFLIFFLANFLHKTWEGGHCFGPRYLVPGIPFLAILAAWGYDNWPRGFQGLAAVGFVFMFVATAIGPLALVAVTQPVFNLAFPLFLDQAIDRTVLKGWGIRGFFSLVPIVAYLGVMGRLMWRRLGLRIDWRGAVRAATVGLAFFLAVFALSQLDRERVHRERGEAYVWAWRGGAHTQRHAANELESARRRDPNQPRTRLLLGHLYKAEMARNDPANGPRFRALLADAIAEYEAALRLDAKQTDAFEPLAELYTLAGRTPEAEEMRRRAEVVRKQ